MSKDNKITLLVGSLFFLIVSVILKLIKPYVFSENGFGKFPWNNQLGLIFILIGVILFIIERWKNLPFFYGRSQNGGSNSNSFFLLCIGIFFLDLSLTQFITVSLIGLLFIGIVGYIFTMLGIKQKSR